MSHQITIQQYTAIVERHNFLADLEFSIVSDICIPVHTYPTSSNDDKTLRGDPCQHSGFVEVALPKPFQAGPLTTSDCLCTTSFRPCHLVLDTFQLSCGDDRADVRCFLRSSQNHNIHHSQLCLLSSFQPF